MTALQYLGRLKWSLLLLVVGVALGFVAIVSFFMIFRDTGISFTAPGETVVTITKPGDYTLWNETRTLIDGQFMSFSEDLPSGTIIRVMKQPEGIDVPLRKTSLSTTEIGGTRRVSVGKLTFTSPGEYRLVVTGLTEKRALYLGEAKFLRLLLRAIVCGLTGMLFVFAGIGSGTYVLVQLSKRERQAAIAT